MSERKACFVYVIGREQGPVKVGISHNPHARVRELQTGCPFKAELLHFQPLPTREWARQIEGDFHAVYDNCRLYGEWFDIEAELAIDGVETAVQIDYHFRFERNEAVN